MKIKSKLRSHKEMPLSKILQGRRVEPGASLHERNKFF